MPPGELRVRGFIDKEGGERTLPSSIWVLCFVRPVAG